MCLFVCLFACVCITGFKGNKGEKGSKGFGGDQGNEGDRGEPGDVGLPGDTGPPGFIGEFGDEGPAGLQGDKGFGGDTGIKGPLGDVGPKGVQGTSGNRGEKGNRGEEGIRGEQGVLGLDGDKGSQGLQGFPGVEGIQGPDGNGGAIGFMGAPVDDFFIVRHSQTQVVPECPPKHTKLWDGWSMLYTRGNGNGAGQDLGDPGSCPRRFSAMPFMRCHPGGFCETSVHHDRSYWLATVTEITRPMGAMEPATVTPHVSRCSVCTAPAEVIAVHSQDNAVPDCYPGWTPLWEGYSFMQVNNNSICVSHLIFCQLQENFMCMFLRISRDLYCLPFYFLDGQCSNF